jgi:tetratricopeptide (TPR) repeat protein
VAGDWEVQVELARNDALVALRKGRLAAARAELERALALQREHLPAEHGEIASTLNNLGTVLTRLNLLDEAIATSQQSLAIHEAVEGPRHPNTAASAHNLAMAWRLVGRYAEAKAQFTRALAVRREVLGPTHPDTLNTEVALARTSIALGELDQAAARLAALRGLPPGVSSDTQRWWRLSAEGELALASGAWKDALTLSAELLELAQRVRPGDSPFAARSVRLRGEALTGLGQWAEATRTLLEAQRLTARADPRDRAEVEEAVGHLELAQSRPAAAAPHFQAALALRDGVGLTSPEQAEALLDLAGCRVELGDGAGAQALAERARALFQGMQVRDGPARAALVLAQAAWLQGGDRALAARGLEAAVAMLPVDQVPRARRWMAAHGVR